MKMNKYIKHKTIVDVSNLDNDKLDIDEAQEILKDSKKPESLFYDGYIKGYSDFYDNSINEDLLNNNNDYNSGYLEAINFGKKLEEQERNIKRFIEWKTRHNLK